MPLKRHQANVNPAMPPYLTYDEQRFVEMYLATGGKLQEITRLWPNVPAEECERLAADPRVSAECECRRELVSKVMRGEKVEPRPGHDPFLEHEHIANAFGERHARLMRHSRISTTMDVYAQMVADSQRQAIAKVTAMVAAKRAEKEPLAIAASQLIN